MIKLNTRVACAVTAALLAPSLFCGVSSHEVEAENSYSPATPQVTMDPNRVLKVTDTTDWGQTHTDSNEVSVLDYGKIVSDEISSGKAVDVSCGTDLIVSVGDDGNLYSCDSKGSKLKKLEVAGNPVDFKVELPDGITVTFSGFVSVTIAGGAVNDAMTFTLSINLNSDLTIA